MLYLYGMNVYCSFLLPLYLERGRCLPLIFSFLFLQMLEVERSQIKDLKGRGYSDRQLQEMGFCENAIHTPSVASLKA